MAVESRVQRIVVALNVPSPTDTQQANTVIEGLDASTATTLWTRTFSYASAGLADNPRTAQVWLLAPGGLITVIAATQGQTTALLPIAASVSTPPHHFGLFLDAARNTGYAVLTATDNGCEIDRVDSRPGARRTAVMHTGNYG